MLNYQAMANVMGNSFAGESGIEIITESNPLNYVEEEKPKKITMNDVLGSMLMK